MKKNVILGLLALLIVGGGIGGYQKFMATTRVAMVNDEDFQVVRIFKANKNRLIKIDTSPLAELERGADYDAVS